MATNGTLRSKMYSNAYWKFDWTAEKVSAGKTKITWTLSTCGKNASYNTECTLKVDDTEKSLGEGVRSFNNKIQATGYFERNHDESGKASFKVKLLVPYIYTTVADPDKFNSQEITFELEINKPYTLIGKPTGIGVSPLTQKPGGVITISWTAAADGTANPVKQYKVWYGFSGEKPMWQTAQYVAATERTKTFVLPSNAPRGKTLIVRVQAIPTISSYGSDYVELNKGTTKINSLPDPPALDLTSVTIPSIGGTVTFEVEAGKDIDGQECSVYYSINDNGAKEPYSDDESLSFSGGATCKFWTYDGLEYSANSTDVEIVLNEKPVINTFDLTSQEKDKYTLIADKDLSTRLEYYNFGFTYNNQFYNTGLIDGNSTVINLREALTSLLGELEQNTTYNNICFWVEGKDAIETSERKISDPIELTTPELTYEGDVGKGLEFSKSIKPISKNETWVPNRVWIEDGEEKVLDDEEGFCNTTELDYGKKIKFIGFSDGGKIAVNWAKIQEYIPALSSNSSLEFSVYTSKQLTLTFLNNEERGGLDSPILYIGNKEIALGEGSTQYTYTYNISAATLIELFALGGKKLSSVSLNCTFKNDANDEFSSEFELKLNYYAEGKMDGLNLCIKVPKSESKYEIEKWEFLTEGMEIANKSDTFFYDCFSEPILRLEWQNEKREWKTLREITTSQIGPSEEKWEYNLKPNRYECQFYSYQIGENIQNYNTNFRLVTTIDGITTEKILYNQDRPVKAHLEPYGQFTSINYTSGTLTTSYSLVQSSVGNGANVNLIGLAIRGVNGVVEVSEIEGQNGIWKEFSGNFGNSEFINITPIFSSILPVKVVLEYGKVENYSFAVKKTESTHYIYGVAYNLSPTVSYRKNHLGINTIDPSSGYNGAVLVVNSSQSGGINRNIVYLQGALESGGAHVSTISLDTGGLKGFVVDCGSWSSIPGGIIPGGELPTGLAKIAYTGEIADLEQERLDIIIVSGGTANEQI